MHKFFFWGGLDSKKDLQHPGQLIGIKDLFSIHATRFLAQLSLPALVQPTETCAHVLFLEASRSIHVRLHVSGYLIVYSLKYKSNMCSELIGYLLGQLRAGLPFRHLHGAPKSAGAVAQSGCLS